MKKSSERKDKRRMKRNLIGLMGICLISTSIFGVYSMRREKNIKELAIRAKQYEEEALTVTAKAPNPDNFTYVTSLDNIQVPVPTGYTASSVESERYVNGKYTTTTDPETGEETTTKEYGGFVIYEGTDPVPTDETGLLNVQKTRNQYVWVPISASELQNMYWTDTNGRIFAKEYSWPASEASNTAANQTREPALTSPTSTSNSYAGKGDYDYTYLTQYMNGITADEFLYEMQARFYEMLESVATYGGFYCRQI